MSGLITTVFLKSRFTDVDSALVMTVLRKLVTDIVETRKGRHWSFHSAGVVAELSVVEVASRLAEFEDDLLSIGLLPEDVSEALVLSFPVSGMQERTTCTAIARRLAKVLCSPWPVLS